MPNYDGTGPLRRGRVVGRGRGRCTQKAGAIPEPDPYPQMREEQEKSVT
jgi:hypothetical protein